MFLRQDILASVVCRIFILLQPLPHNKRVPLLLHDLTHMLGVCYL